MQTKMTIWALFPVENWCSIVGEMKRYQLMDYLWSYIRVFMCLQDAQLDPSIRGLTIRDSIRLVCTKWTESVQQLKISKKYFDDRIDERFAERVRASLPPFTEMDEIEYEELCQVFDHRHIVEFVTLYYRDIIRISDTYEKYSCHIDNLKHFLKTWLQICDDLPPYFFKRIIGLQVNLVHFQCQLFDLFLKYRSYSNSHEPKDIAKVPEVQKQIVQLGVDGSIRIAGSGGNWAFFVIIFIILLIILALVAVFLYFR